MICSQCRTRNPIGNKFCRECGTKLTDIETGSLEAEEAARAESERRTERAAALLTEAFRLSEQERIDEALPLAREATELLPESSSALSLLASLYERSEQMQPAIEIMERVVKLNPGSVADETKLDQLRRGVHVLPKRSPSFRRPLPSWSPFVAAGAVAAMVLGAGLSLIHTSSARSETTDERIPVGPPQAASGAPAPPQGSPATPGAAAPNKGEQRNRFAGPPPAARPDPFAPLSPNGSMGRQTSVNASAGRTGGVTLPPLPPPGTPLANVPPPRRFRSPSGAGSAARSASGSGMTTLPPLPQGSTVPNAVQPAPGLASPDRIVVRAPGSPEANSGSAAGTPPSDGSYIRITVRAPGQSHASSPGAPPPPAVVEKSPFETGQEMVRAGRYNDAVAAFQKALPGLSGYSRGIACQMMALSYRRLGRTREARDAYQQALSAFQEQISTGRNTGPAQRGIQACTDALEELAGA